MVVRRRLHGTATYLQTSCWNSLTEADRKCEKNPMAFHWCKNSKEVQRHFSSFLSSFRELTYALAQIDRYRIGKTKARQIDTCDVAF